MQAKAELLFKLSLLLVEGDLRNRRSLVAVGQGLAETVGAARQREVGLGALSEMSGERTRVKD